MIKSITITNYLGESIVLELDKPNLSGLLVKDVTGLGPPESTINSSEVASGDGSVYNSARSSSRNIVFEFYLLFHPTVEEARHLTYKYFPLKKPVDILVENGSRLCEITGYVETNEPDIFSEKETAQISVICPNPWFRKKGVPDDYTTVVFSGVESLFQFPFSNESLTEKKILFGNIKTRQEEYVVYEGEVETGFIIIMHALGEVRQITIYNTVTRERMHIDTDRIKAIVGSAIKAGDEITISTVKGQKYAEILRDGEYYNILNALDKDTDWFTLRRGDNRFAYIADYGAEDLEFQIKFQTLYEGV